jgi:hypothetical protein
MRQSFRKVLQQRLLEEDFEGVTKSLITLSDQIGNNLLMNDAMLFYQRWQAFQKEIAKDLPPSAKARHLKAQLKHGLWQTIEKLPE